MHRSVCSGPSRTVGWPRLSLRTSRRSHSAWSAHPCRRGRLRCYDRAEAVPAALYAYRGASRSAAVRRQFLCPHGGQGLTPGAGRRKESYSLKEEKMNFRRNENKTNYKDGSEALRRVGFTENEIQQLTQLRRDRTELEMSQTSAEYRRLAFVRWLVATGKLSDQLA